MEIFSRGDGMDPHNAVPEAGQMKGIHAPSSVRAPLLGVFTARGGMRRSPESPGRVSELVSSRPVRNGALRDLLDEEFRRCYRFEGLASLFHDIKSLLRKMVEREEDLEEPDLFIPGP